ncbi:hypothetical protein BV25DRAFT_1795619 [Artomyces pyxidatus]|uniref:Uncharacterized protein n=1 Tax=Artomyces pyxidatus TaxID=48021 RepID=A0ACB8TES9_9AGAM|nr:hypothetical protein BV25DRAFT_1795619 [Artomyces pyxidatus]
MTRPAIRAVLIDLSGTLHVGAKPTDGAARALQRLRDARVPFRFCSNTSKEATSVLKEKLAGMGLGPRDGELWTSVGAVKDVLRVKGVKRPYIIASDSAKEECQGGVTEDPGVPYDAVVIAFAPAQFDYAALNTAFRVLMHEQTPRPDPKPAAPPTIPFITTHRSRYVEDHDSALSLGPGPFVTALEHATGRTAEVVGKPTRAFFEMVQASLQPSTSAAARVVIIGDDVQNDLGEGAQELGLWRVLVRTGKYRPGDERREGVLPPDEVFDSFAAFVDSLLS